MKATYEEISRSEALQGSGKYKPLLRRQIDGHRCTCFAYEFIHGEAHYWNVEYRIDGVAPKAFNSQISRMGDLLEQKAKALTEAGQKTILWRY